MEKSKHTFVIIFVFILFNATCRSLPGNSTLMCKPFERAALLKFKHSLNYFDESIFSSWVGEDCCYWQRVSCDHTTGSVLKLHLSGNKTRYGLNKPESLMYLLELKQLEYLDLSFNDFGDSLIPDFMGSMKQLRYLNLSYCSLGGWIPHELSNQTNLQVLDLAGNDGLNIDSLGWVSGLRQLRYLNMGSVDLSKAHDWMESLIGPLPHLQELHLSRCQLYLHKSAYKNASFDSPLIPIRYLDLSENNLEGEFPLTLRILTSLEHLDLSGNSIGNLLQDGNLWGLVHNLCRLRTLDISNNKLDRNFFQQNQNLSDNCGSHYDLEYLALFDNMFSGEFPSFYKFPPNLEYLDLGGNQLSGQMPISIGQLTKLQRLSLRYNNLSSISSSFPFPPNLEYLDLSVNQLSGQIPISIGQLTKLTNLDISDNPMEGTVLTELHFANLSSLRYLYMWDTFLTLNMSSDWVPPFQLQYLSADNCKINGQLPPWLQTQKNLTELSLSSANISGLMPKWLHTMQVLSFVDLSNNKLSGSPIFPIYFEFIILSNNSLSGECLSNVSHKQVYRTAVTVSLSTNQCSGPISKNIGHIMPYLEFLDLSNNQINGNIPKSLCLLTSLRLLDIQNNSLSGVIPNYWPNSSDLFLVNLSYNKLIGHIPCFNNSNSLVGEFYLHVNDNIFSGEIPSCLNELEYLQVLDLGGNQLSGKIPEWLVEQKHRDLKILRLRGNYFSGMIPTQICSLSQLQILDLGHNHFTGSIPPCLSNLTAMTSYNIHTALEIDMEFGGYESYDSQKVNEVYQGTERGYTTTLRYLVDIDLSCNYLMGIIPRDITNLSSLLSLNLSNNQLSGTIPQNIGGLKSLIALDLSNNKLKGVIPRSVAQLYHLSYLNLSYNNFSGAIPTGDQLQALSDPASIYAGNPYLCGDSLPKKCIGQINKQGNGIKDEGNGQDDDKREMMWFVLVVMSGVATGFWGVVGSLVLKRSWRHAFFRRVEAAYDWVYVIVALRMAKINKT